MSASLETDIFAQCYVLVVVHATIGLNWTCVGLFPSSKVIFSDWIAYF